MRLVQLLELAHAVIETAEPRRVAAVLVRFHGAVVIDQIVASDALLEDTSELVVHVDDRIQVV